jgi:hypothetical protein
MFECPFYKELNACITHPNCVFRKAGGCAIELGAILSEENQREIEKLANELNTIKSKLNNIEYQIRSIYKKVE